MFGLEFELFLRVLYAGILSFLLGLEREISKKPAGMRTHILVGMGAALFTVAGLYGFPHADQSRLAAYVVAGIGFIGAGAILQMRDKVVGLTTAASLWLAAAIGVAAGVGFYYLAGFTALVGFLLLELKKVEEYVRSRHG